MKNNVTQLLENIKPFPNSHGTGFKKVFLSNKDIRTNLTQFAYGFLKPGEGCENHFHPTMEEYFFFLKGRGQYWIDGRIIKLNPNMFLRIPANIEHYLVNTGNKDLEFVYFGVECE